MEASAILKMVEDASDNCFLSLMSLSAMMTVQYELFSSIHPKATKVKCWSHPKENLMIKYQSYPSLKITPIVWRLYLSKSFPSSTKVGLSDVDAPKQILSDSINIGGIWYKQNRGKTIEELSEASKVPIEQKFNIHENCSEKWWFKTRALE